MFRDVTEQIALERKSYLPCRLILRIHTQPRPQRLLQLASLFSRKAVLQLNPSVLQKVLDLLLRELVLLFCVCHLDLLFQITNPGLSRGVV